MDEMGDPLRLPPAQLSPDPRTWTPSLAAPTPGWTWVWCPPPTGTSAMYQPKAGWETPQLREPGPLGRREWRCGGRGHGVVVSEGQRCHGAVE